MTDHATVYAIVDTGYTAICLRCAARHRANPALIGREPWISSELCGACDRRETSEQEVKRNAGLKLWPRTRRIHP